MTRYRISLIFTLIIFLALAAWAGGKKEFGGQSVNGKENWDYRYDLSDQKPGKYNLIIEGTDKAGNKTIAGPYNVWIDPESDVPVVTIINPVADQRVGQNLNIVGTCVDDDAVDHVEIQLDGGEILKATGKDYWSYYLDGSSIPDGRHTITVTGVDSKGVKSKPVSVAFNLDKFKPAITVVSHENGVLISGQVTIKGRVDDANGIAKIQASFDGGKNYRDIGLQQDKSGSSATFDLGIDTRKMKDGPNILWLRSTDRTRSTGLSAFLLMVDNTKPEIRILNPLPVMAVHGITGFAGMVFDAVGVDTLSWDHAGQSGTIQLYPGNPFFTVDLDFTKVAGKEAVVNFHAVDRAGNRQDLKYPLKIDTVVDKPVVAAVNLKDKDTIPPDFGLALNIRDDDGVKSLVWQLDKEAEKTVGAKESTVLPLAGLASGPHVISLRAIDSLDVPGPVLAIAFTVKSPPPVVSKTGLDIDGSPRYSTSIPGFFKAGSFSWLPGLRLLQDGANVLWGSVTAGNKLKTVEWQLEGDAKWQTLTVSQDKDSGDWRWSIPLPKTLRFGVNRLSVRATDEFGQVGQTSCPLYVVNYSRINEEPAIVFMDSRIGADGVVPLSANHPLEGLFVGSDAQSLRLEPASDTVKAELDGNRVVVSYLKDGLTQPLTLVVTSREKHEIRSAPLVFRSDSTPPAITVKAPLLSAKVKTPLVLEAEIQDLGGIAALAYSFDKGQNWLPLALPTGAAGRVKAELPLDGIEDGPLVALVKARDQSGNEAVLPQAVLKDSAGPRIAIDTPLDSAWGFLPVVGHISDLSNLAVLQYRIGPGEFQDLPGSTLDKRFVIPADFGTDRNEPVEFAVRAVDQAGNETVETRTVGAGPAPGEPAAPVPDDKGKLPEPPKPKVTLVTPAAADAVHGAITAVFQLADWQPAYATVKFTVAGQAPRVIAGPGSTGELQNNFFVAAIDLGAAKSGQLVCTFDFEGEKRKAAVPVTVKSSPESDRPLASVFWQSGAPGWAAVYGSDDGIQKISALVDGKPAEVSGTGGIGLISLPELAVGTHGLTVWAADTNGLAGPRSETKFQARDKAPSIDSFTLIQGGTSRPFSAGASLVLGKDDKLQVAAAFPNGFKSLDYKINGTAGTAKGSGSGTVGKLDIPLPPTLPWGLNALEITATGAAGFTTVRQVFFYRLAVADPQAEDGIGVVFDADRSAQAGFIPVDPEHPLRGFFNGRPVKSIEILPPDPDLSVNVSGNSFQLVPLRPTLSGQRQLVVTDIDGDRFKSEPFTVHHDPEPPRIVLDSLANGDWLQKRLPISGTVADNLGIQGLEYAVYGAPATAEAETPVPAGEAGNGLLKPEPGVFAPLETGPAAADRSLPFKAAIDLSGLADGTVVLALRATDSFGTRSTALWAVSKDNRGPVLVQLTPPETEKVNGRITTAGKARDAGRIVLVEFSSDHKNWVPIPGGDIFAMDLDFGSYPRLPERWWWRATDAAGNVSEYNPGFNIDQESDLPVVTVQTPSEGETVRNDFKISGIAFDDDGVKNLYYRLDYVPPPAKVLADGGKPVFGPANRPAAAPGVLLTNPNAARQASGGESVDLSTFTRIIGKNSFDLAMKLLDVGDNEHLFEIVGEDINGTVGHVVKRAFRVSTAEPTSQLIEPATGITIRGSYSMGGTAADANGIREVWLSFDNGSSWVKATGAESWSYRLDSTVLKDGVHSVIIKTIDQYDTEGLYNTIITVDNTAPAISLDTPKDGEQASGTLRLSGRLSDNLSLSSAVVTLLPADFPLSGNGETVSQELSTKTVLLQDVDIGQLPPGWYTMRIEARDQAANTTWISRDIQVVETQAADRVDILFPVEEEVVSGRFSLGGRVFTRGHLPETVALAVNGSPLGEFPLSKTGHFNVPLGPDQLASGSLQVTASIPNAVAIAAGGDPSSTISSQPRRFQYQTDGAWLSFGSFDSGDYLSERVFLKGSAGYRSPLPETSDDQGRRARAQDIKDHEPRSVQISMDHGVSWQDVKGTADWQYRIETQNYPNGDLYLLFRLNLANGATVVRHAILTVDRSPPTVTVLKPAEEGRYNETIDIAGTASDNYELDGIKVNLRTGDKAAYQVPSFIQGLYVDVRALGTTTWEAGAGLTFFDNNVKLQVNLGQMPAVDPLSGDAARFDGFTLGGKLIANVLFLPFSYFFGPDLDFFSMSLGMGAEFVYVTMSGNEFNFDKPGLVLGAALAQVEFARFTFADWDAFSTWGLYTEASLWFISSDVEATVSFKLSFGARVNIF